MKKISNECNCPYCGDEIEVDAYCTSCNHAKLKRVLNTLVEHDKRKLLSDKVKIQYANRHRLEPRDYILIVHSIKKLKK